MAFKLFNTLTRKKQVFRPLKPDIVRMYSCGPTVYNFPHMGNYRAYIFADLLRKYLNYKCFKVVQIMNITDVEDKIIRDSQKEGVSLTEFTRRYENAFFEDLEKLRIPKADVHPRATEHINEMVALIRQLLEKGIAYKADDESIYYNIRKFRNYGKLAQLDKTELLAGASGRILADEYKKEQVQDFALWKAWSPEDGDVFWDTDIGRGRPGWHIECSAMSMKYLGESFDIHTGGVDLVFPHHQNEIAQSEGVTKTTFVKFWVHNEWLLVDGQKMSKSLGNFYTLRDVLAKGYDSLAVRYLLLATHYRQSLNFTFEGLDAAKNALERLWDFVRKLKEIKTDGENPKIEKHIVSAKRKFESSLDNDLEISPALASVFDFVRKINTLIDKSKVFKSDADKVLDFLKSIDSVLSILKDDEAIPQEVLVLVDQREKARAGKNWEAADALRKAITEKGYVVEDTEQGPRVKKA